jgi:hypothetical protein
MTGALSVVVEYMDQARACELRMASMIENDCWNTAIEQKLQAEKLKVQAAIEFLLWLGAVMKMAPEPKPWEELQAKLAKEKEEKEKQDG